MCVCAPVCMYVCASVFAYVCHLSVLPALLGNAQRGMDITNIITPLSVCLGMCAVVFVCVYVQACMPLV